MTIRWHLWLLTCAASLAACHPSHSSATAPHCSSSTRAVWSADSLIALCVPPDFVAGNTGGWGRHGVGTSFVDFLSLELVTWSRDSASFGQWPPHIASGPNCFADCATADSVVLRADTIAGFQVRVESGLASGGEQGWRKQPFLVVGWTVNDSLRAYGYAWARHPATIDTLRALLGTVRFALLSS